MGQDYLKKSKLFTLNTTAATPITGASVIHAMYNGMSSATCVLIDGSYIMHIPADNYISFPKPVAFDTVAMSNANTTGVILYS
jgi:hypothetical protein